MVKFFLEASLGGLAKWLRFLGQDVKIAEGKICLEILLKHRDYYFLITSPHTAQLLEKIGISYLLLPRDSLRGQIQKVLSKLNLEPKLKLNVCTLCGVELINIKKEDYQELIPPRVYALYEEFNRCPQCGRIYWEGDHVKRLKEKWKALTS